MGFWGFVPIIFPCLLVYSNTLPTHVCVCFLEKFPNLWEISSLGGCSPATRTHHHRLIHLTVEIVYIFRYFFFSRHQRVRWWCLFHVSCEAHRREKKNLTSSSLNTRLDEFRQSINSVKKINRDLFTLCWIHLRCHQRKSWFVDNSPPPPKKRGKLL